MANKRSYTGCITCRNRKVKCDGKRPKCMRCAKANLDCAGYGFKLRFKETLVVKNDNLTNLESELADKPGNDVKRQKIDLMHFPESQYYPTFEEVDTILEKVDALDSDSDSRIGPFSIFKLVKTKFNQQILNVKTEDPIVSVVSTNKDDSVPIHVAPILPSFSSIVNNTMLQDSGNASTNFASATVLPLVPALEMQHQRAEQQNNYDNENVKFKQKNLENIQNQIEDHDTDSFPWLHPRLEIDAILTYQAIIGSSEMLKEPWSVMKKTVFSDLYETTGVLQNRIVDKFSLSFLGADKVSKTCVLHLFKLLNDDINSTISIPSFTGLLRSHRVQELVRVFVKSHPNILFLNFEGSIFDKCVIPMLYKIVGELLVIECSLGLPNECDGAVCEGGIEFRTYCDILKRTFCMLALSLTAFSQYKVLFSEYGIYDGSLKLFKCFIAFREMSLVNLSILIKPFLDPGSLKQGDYKIVNQELFENLNRVGLVKELVLSLILAIYQDSSLDIINNYDILHGALRGIREFCDNCNQNEDHMDDLWEWFRYLDLFYKSCSKIDFVNYSINEDGFEDVVEDYNMIKDFTFDDTFSRKELNKIEIKTVNITEQENKNDSDDETSFDDATAEGSNFDMKKKDLLVVEETTELPRRLAKRPVLEDKPPRTFSVRFNFAEDLSESDESSDEDSVDHNLMNTNSDSNSQQDNIRKLTPLNVDDNEKSLICLDAIANHMTLEEREQRSDESGKIVIPHPSKIGYRDAKQKPSAMEMSFGIPHSLLILMEKTVKLTDHKNWCLRKKIFPRNFPKICCDLEDDLVSWKLEWDLYTENIQLENNLQFHSLFHKALYHVVVAFYNSLLIYFFTLIKEYDPVLLQKHVLTTIKHLEELRHLSTRSEFLKDVKISPPFWCFLISGSEATTPALQTRFDELGRKWFVAGNKWIGKQVMMEVWRSRSEAEKNDQGNLEHTSWLDLVKTWEISGFN